MPPKATVWILGSQLDPDHPALQQAEPGKLTVLLIESDWLLKNRPAPFRRRVLVLSAMRHYAAELEQIGWQVDYRRAENFQTGLKDHIQEYSPAQIITMEAADFQGRNFQQNLETREDLPPLTILPNTHFLVESHNPYPNQDPDKNILQEYFYRRMRSHFQILVDDHGQPSGGSWNFDRENRRKLPDQIQIPDPIQFAPDSITREVIDQLLETENPDPDQAEFNLAVTGDQAHKALADFIQNRLPDFGAYEDAMSDRSDLIFHSGISPYLNLGLIHPLEAVQAAEKAYQEKAAPINSVEGFIRQVLGWREYIYWQYWHTMPDLLQVNYWEANNPLPGFFWNGETQLNCLKIVLRRALQSGYTHHIERLMVLSNFCTLTGISPPEVLEWFMAVYIDAYPWVMAPNLLGMGLNADGGGVGTKPYISSANYINKMSSYCRNCSYNAKQRTGDNACPFNFLYWNFLISNQDKLQSNPRMALSLNNLKRIKADEQKTIQNQSRLLIDQLTRQGKTLDSQEEK